MEIFLALHEFRSFIALASYSSVQSIEITQHFVDVMRQGITFAWKYCFPIQGHYIVLACNSSVQSTRNNPTALLGQALDNLFYKCLDPTPNLPKFKYCRDPDKDGVEVAIALAKEAPQTLVQATLQILPHVHVYKYRLFCEFAKAQFRALEMTQRCG